MKTVKERLYAGAASTDITPEGPVWMDGMIRAHRSGGVRDRLHARVLVLSNGPDASKAVAIVSVDVCALCGGDADAIRREASARSGIPPENVLVSTTHTHSGPAAFGYFNPKETGFVRLLGERVAEAARVAVSRLEPARAFHGESEERTVSYYRRLLADDGHVVMNWETFPAERIVKVLGEADPRVAVTRFAAGDGRTVATLFHHPCHPNALSGENYLLTDEYPGLAARLVARRHGGEALFQNGAQGSVDIDNFRDREWEGMDRLGHALADAVERAIAGERELPSPRIAVHGRSYDLPARRITDAELAWAREVLSRTGGELKPVADGVGDDYKAKLLQELREVQDRPIRVEQTCVSFGDCAYLSFPGELYTEVGLAMGKDSPFPHTHLVGLTNGSIGYIPTAQAIREGGYSEDTRRVDAAAADIVLAESLALLREARKG